MLQSKPPYIPAALKPALETKKKKCTRNHPGLISVSIAFEWSIDLNTNIVCLLLSGNCQLSAQSWKMQCRHLFIEMFWKQVHLVLVALVLFPICQQVQLA